MKTIAEVKSLCTKIRRPELMESMESLQSQMTTGQIISADGVSSRNKAMLTFFKPILERADWTGGDGHNPVYSKQLETTKKLLACHAMLNKLRMGPKRLAKEAQLWNEVTTAGVDLPTFVRQLLLTITRAYARLFTIELFGVLPLNQPYGRINFKDYLYGDTYTGSLPNTTGQVSRTDDITAFNTGYYQVGEGQDSRSIEFKYSNLDVSVNDFRVIGQWTDQLSDDAMSVYDDDAESSLIDHMAQEMSRVIDRSMITATLNAIPAANIASWNATPTSNPNYVALSPAEQEKYDAQLYRIGINQVTQQIRTTCKYNDMGEPEWGICGTNFAYALNKVSMFRAFESKGGSEIDIQRGALRDIGTLQTTGVRYLVDVMLGITAYNTGVSGATLSNGVYSADGWCIYGKKPRVKSDWGIYWMPYINLQPTRDLYDPKSGTTTKGVRSRWAIAQPNTGLNPASAQLGYPYGLLQVTNAAVA